MNGSDNRFRSRKFIVAVATFFAVTVLAMHGEFSLAKDAGDTALVIGSSGAVYGIILKLYNDANIAGVNQ